MRITVELRHTADGVEGHVTREGGTEPEPFSSWLELLRILELPPADGAAEEPAARDAGNSARPSAPHLPRR